MDSRFLSAEKHKFLHRTYVDGCDSLELAVLVDETRSVATEDLLDARPRQFYVRWQHLRTVLGRSCSTIVIVRCAGLELSHLLKSIITARGSSL